LIGLSRARELTAFARPSENMAGKAVFCCKVLSGGPAAKNEGEKLGVLGLVNNAVADVHSAYRLCSFLGLLRFWSLSHEPDLSDRVTLIQSWRSPHSGLSTLQRDRPHAYVAGYELRPYGATVSSSRVHDGRRSSAYERQKVRDFVLCRQWQPLHRLHRLATDDRVHLPEGAGFPFQYGSDVVWVLSGSAAILPAPGPLYARIQARTQAANKGGHHKYLVLDVTLPTHPVAQDRRGIESPFGEFDVSF